MLVSICLLSEAATVLEGTVEAPRSRALLKVIVCLQLLDMPGEVFHAPLYQTELTHSLIQLVPILPKEFITTFLPCGIVSCHAYDDPNLTKGEIEFLEFCNSVDIDNIRISIETLTPICTALGHLSL